MHPRSELGMWPAWTASHCVSHHSTASAFMEMPSYGPLLLACAYLTNRAGVSREVACGGDGSEVQRMLGSLCAAWATLAAGAARTHT